METKSLIPRVWEVPEIFRRRLGNKVGRQRLMEADGHLLLVLHLPPAPDEIERQGRLIWRRPDGTWTWNDLGSGPQVVNKHLDQYADLIQKCDDQEEHAGNVEDYFSVMERLAPLMRAARHQHQVLQEARKACPDDREIINFRDRAYEIERSAELLYSETKNSLDLAVARRAEEQAESSRRMAVSAHRLNLLAAFFFPLATISAVFGTNLRHGLETLPPPWPLLALVGVGLLCGIVLTGFVTASKR
ncbi:MAG: CorA family divalent cation transporter [Planctomycetes bacterium]|nr:CorA family divalent cation transporter [Planctomycetota bacterium]